jgi:hypothetical protein
VPFQFAGLPEKFFFDAAWADALDGCANRSLRADYAKKIGGSGWFSCSPKARPRPWRQASVDKPMHIHRIECAKPAEFNTADLLSS